MSLQVTPSKLLLMNGGRVCLARQRWLQTWYRTTRTFCWQCSFVERW